MGLNSQMTIDKYKLSTQIKYAEGIVINCEYTVNTIKEFKELIQCFPDKSTNFVSFMEDAYKVTIMCDVPVVLRYVTIE